MGLTLGLPIIFYEPRLVRPFGRKETLMGSCDQANRSSGMNQHESHEEDEYGKAFGLGKIWGWGE